MSAWRGLAVVLALSSALGVDAAAAAPSTANGRQIAVRNCGMCHAIGLKGASRNAEAPPFRTLSARYPIEALEESLAEGIRTGHPAMPEFRFSPVEIQDLVAYIKSVQPRAQAQAAGRTASAR